MTEVAEFTLGKGLTYISELHMLMNELHDEFLSRVKRYLRISFRVFSDH